MPEATVLYSVTGVVIVGLIAWVSMVLTKAKEPWSRPAPAEEPAAVEEAPEAKKDDVADEVAATTDDKAPKLNADDTARATPVALSEGRQKAASETSEVAKEAPAEKPAEEEKKDEETKAEA